MIEPKRGRAEERKVDAGPASTEQRAMRKYLLRRGVKEPRLPALLRDGIIGGSKKGPVGKVVVRAMSGVESNTASRVIGQFEENVGGKEEVAAKLAALPDLPEDLKGLVKLIEGGGKRSLAYLIAEAKVEPTKVMRAYARGCVEMGVVMAAIEAHKHLPRVIKDLYYHALDREELCKTCVGSGMVKQKPQYGVETQLCIICEGTGRLLTSSKHKEWAGTKVLEITKMVEKGGVQVNVNQQSATFSGGGGSFSGGFMEKVLLATDAILNPAPSRRELPPAPPDIVEAEVVSS